MWDFGSSPTQRCSVRRNVGTWTIRPVESIATGMVRMDVAARVRPRVFILAGPAGDVTVLRSRCGCAVPTSMVTRDDGAGLVRQDVHCSGTDPWMQRWDNAVNEAPWPPTIRAIGPGRQIEGGSD